MKNKKVKVNKIFTSKVNKTFTSKVDTTCKLKLHIPLEIVDNIYPELKKKIEVSGVINCNNSDQVISIDKNHGSADSVYTPNNVINFHTHPVSAYQNAHTVWGWPSGEDIRETIKFVLNGNKAHLVFTVEGVYTIQVSPCKIKRMKELLNDAERGVLIFLIEEYFKTTHNFRGTTEVNNLAKKRIFINPYSFVHFANSFDLKNLLATKKIVTKNVPMSKLSKVGHSGIHGPNNIKKYSSGEDTSFSKIPANGFPIVEDNYFINLPIKEYITPEELNDLRVVNVKGQESSPNIKNITEIIKKIKSVFETFEQNKCTSEWNNNPNSWFFVNFFPTLSFLNKDYLKGTTFVEPTVQDFKLKYEPFIRIFSNESEGCKIHEIAKKNKFKIKCKLVKKNSFGISNITNDQRVHLYNILAHNIHNKLSIKDLVKLTNLHSEQISSELRILKKFLEK